MKMKEKQMRGKRKISKRKRPSLKLSPKRNSKKRKTSLFVLQLKRILRRKKKVRKKKKVR